MGGMDGIHSTKAPAKRSVDMDSIGQKCCTTVNSINDNKLSSNIYVTKMLAKRHPMQHGLGCHRPILLNTCQNGKVSMSCINSMLRHCFQFSTLEIKTISQDGYMKT
jgi:hypothetical protein